jgi:hypothetical protein
MRINYKVMNTNHWEKLGMTWLRNPKPTKGCKAIGEDKAINYFKYEIYEV